MYQRRQRRHHQLQRTQWQRCGGYHYLQPLVPLPTATREPADGSVQALHQQAVASSTTFAQIETALDSGDPKRAQASVIHGQSEPTPKAQQAECPEAEETRERSAVPQRV